MVSGYKFRMFWTIINFTKGAALHCRSNNIDIIELIDQKPTIDKNKILMGKHKYTRDFNLFGTLGS